MTGDRNVRIAMYRIGDPAPRPSRPGQEGQVLAIGVVMILLLIAMAALVIEGGNAYAQQRLVQNGSDAAANAGAAVLAARLGGSTRTDADVLAAVTSLGAANTLTLQPALYTDVKGHPLDSSGGPATGANPAAAVGGGAIPPNAQGVQVTGSRRFATYIGRAVGFDSFTASATATAVTGRLVGGPFLPIVFPINIVDCEKNGDLGTGEVNWALSDPADPPTDRPIGQEYIVPLCKTGGGSFMILDLDGNNKTTCADEVTNPPPIVWNDFPVVVDSNQGNDCAKKLVDDVNGLHGQVVLIPVCIDLCVTGNGSNAQYTITKVAAFYVDYMSDTNNKNNQLCTGTAANRLTTIAGNGSDSCLVGWFVRYITTGPVGTGTIGNSDSIGVQLIR